MSQGSANIEKKPSEAYSLPQEEDGKVEEINHMDRFSIKSPIERLRSSVQEGMRRTKSGVLTLETKDNKRRGQPGYGTMRGSKVITTPGAVGERKNFTLRGTSTQGKGIMTLRSKTHSEHFTNRSFKNASGKLSDRSNSDLKNSSQLQEQNLQEIVIGEDDVDMMEEKKKKTKKIKFPFQGKWQSSEVELDTFINELNLSNKFAKLAVTFGGDVTQKLKIKQKSKNDFVITEDNERRKIKYEIVIGEDFVSLNEKDEELNCSSRWGESELELVIEEQNSVTNEKTIITRKVDAESTTLLETRKVDDKPETTRTYHKVVKQKKKTKKF